MLTLIDLCSICCPAERAVDHHCVRAAVGGWGRRGGGGGGRGGGGGGRCCQAAQQYMVLPVGVSAANISAVPGACYRDM